MDKRIGFIGLGNMGAPMAQRLVDAGCDLMVHDVRTAFAKNWNTERCRYAATLLEIANKCEFIFLCLPTPDVVEQVVLGEDGLSSGHCAKNIIDLSTTGPIASKLIADALAGSNKTFIDAPVSGGMTGAVEGTLAIMVACSPDNFAILQPVLKPLGQAFHVGNEPGMGQTLKVLNNLLSSAALALTAELMVTGVKAGLDASTMIDVFNVSSGRNSATIEKFPKAVLTRSFDFGFTHKLVNKDASLCLSLAKQQGLTLPIATIVLETWRRALAEIGPDEDFTTIVKLYEREAGIEIHQKE